MVAHTRELSRVYAMHTLTTLQPHRDTDDDRLADEYLQNFELDKLVGTLPAYARAFRLWPKAGPYSRAQSAAADPCTPPRTPPASVAHDLLWPPRMREPLDMRTVSYGNFEEWSRRERRDQNPHSQQEGLRMAAPLSGPHRANRPSSSGDNLISEDLLTTLRASELNKRLHGCPLDKVTKLKHRRRALLNRVYAKKCRDRRELKVQELEQENRTLHEELHMLRVQVARVTHERDVVEQELALAQHSGPVPLHVGPTPLYAGPVPQHAGPTALHAGPAPLHSGLIPQQAGTTALHAGPAPLTPLSSPELFSEL